MTNLLAAIIVTVSTNWTTIGTFTPGKDGIGAWPTHDVQEGRVTTNVIAIAEWKGQKVEFPLETVPGPVIGERRVERQLKIIAEPTQLFKYPPPGFFTMTNDLSRSIILN